MSDERWIFVDDGVRYYPPPGLVDIQDTLCGCGRPIAVWHDMATYLLGTMEQNHRGRPLQGGGEYLFAYHADNYGWTNHGGSVLGAWMTRRGYVALSFLLEFGGEFVGTEKISEAVKWHRPPDEHYGWRYVQPGEEDDEIYLYGIPTDRCICEGHGPLELEVGRGDRLYCEECYREWVAVGPEPGRWLPETTFLNADGWGRDLVNYE